MPESDEIVVLVDHGIILVAHPQGDAIRLRAHEMQSLIQRLQRACKIAAKIPMEERLAKTRF